MITVGVVFFRTLRLEHLDAAWYSLSRQDFRGVSQIVFLDNNTAFTEAEITEVLGRYHMPVPVATYFEKHGDETRTQSWSCNYVGRTAQTRWLFLTRADFLLDDDCLAQFKAKRDEHAQGWRGFVTSWCHQMGYDAQLSNTDALAPYSLPDAAWRQAPLGAKSLFGQVPACYFQATDKDAGVWLVNRLLFEETGGLNERMVSWGYQQQAFQRALERVGAEIVVIPDYLFHHQHHHAVRDFQQAADELRFE